MAHQLKFLGILLLLGVHCGHSDDNVQIKIVEAPALSRFPSMPSNSQKQLTLRVKPASVSGPPHLQQLAGQCFSTQQKGYTYNVCPFHNVTQKEDRMSWNSFHGVLGVWREWLIENDSFVGMHFVKGERCGSKDREAKLLFNCSTLTQLYNVSEPSTCKYTIWLDTPLACFKGAMQVYHLLSPKHLKQWDELEGEYYRGELTFKGLSKQRRQILMEAGLLYDPERDREPEIKDSEPKAKGDDGGFELVPEMEAPPTISPLVRCIQERLRLEKELGELREKIHDAVREFPALAHKFNFTQNASSTASPVNATRVSTASPYLPESKPANASPHLPEGKDANSPHLPEGNRSKPEQVIGMDKPHRTEDSDHRGDTGNRAAERKPEFEQQANNEKVEAQRTEQKFERLEGQKTEMLEGQNTEGQRPERLHIEEQRTEELILEALRMGDVEAGKGGVVPGEREGGPDAERGENEENIDQQLADLLRGEEIQNLLKEREP